MPIPLIIPLLLSVIGQAEKSRQEGENATKQEEYLREQKRREEEQARRDYMASRMSNMGNILGYRMNPQSGKPVSGAPMPTLNKKNLGDILSSLGEAGMSLYGAQSMQEPAGTYTNPISSSRRVPSPGLWMTPSNMTGQRNPAWGDRAPWEQWSAGSI